VLALLALLPPLELIKPLGPSGQSCGRPFQGLEPFLEQFPSPSEAWEERLWQVVDRCSVLPLLELEQLLVEPWMATVGSAAVCPSCFQGQRESVPHRQPRLPAASLEVLPGLLPPWLLQAFLGGPQPLS
jgi:hypothetical protein